MPLAKEDSSYKGLKEDEIAFIEKHSWGGLSGFVFFLFNKVYSYPLIVLVAFLSYSLYRPPKSSCIHWEPYDFEFLNKKFGDRCTDWTEVTNYKPTLFTILILTILTISVYGMFAGHKVIWKKRNWESFKQYQKSMRKWDSNTKSLIKIAGAIIGLIILFSIVLAILNLLFT